MRLLFTSDWQVDFGNLQESEVALEELLSAAAKYRPEAIIHAGDVKDAYSPVDVEVVKFCVRMVRRVREAGHRLIILLGNHDRISQSTESKNWLDVLQAAGAEVVTRPRVKQVGGISVALLPYAPSSEDEVKGAEELRNATSVVPGPRILVFHNEITGSVINASGRMGKGLTPEQMGFGHYAACFGGHIHRHQRIADNGWYIGSPFCQDWGEADSSHGMVLAEIKADAVKVKQLVTKIPHWYTLDYLKSSGIEPEAGAYIRAKVPVSSKKITDQLRAEEERIRNLYGDVRVHMVPELAEDAAPDLALRGSSDREQLEHYTAATIAEAARFEPAAVVSYMLSKLNTQKDAAGGELYFTGVEAENVLVLERVKMKLARLGIVMIRGVNEDWPGRSNGAGKSSVLSLIPVAMFGQVPNKKQKSDAWAYEGNDDPAVVTLYLRDAKGRKIRIRRGRRPHLIRMWIDGEDKSSGLRGTGKNETQGLIEDVTGYDMQMMLNAVYIDQNVANGFVFGTPSGRMDLVARFQNLERFEAARKAVVADLEKAQNAMTAMNADIELMQERRDRLEDLIHETDKTEEHDWIAALKEERDKLGALQKEHAALGATAEFYKELQRDLDDLENDRKKAARDWEQAVRLGSEWNYRLESGRKLVAAGKCPICRQPSKDAGRRIVEESREQAESSRQDTARLKQQVGGMEEKIRELRERMEICKRRKREMEQDMDHSRGRVRDLESAAAEQEERNRSRAEKAKELRQEITLTRRYHAAAMAAREALWIDLEMMEFAKKAFHRSGIPLYLSLALCPLLNRAADEYSDVFTDGNLKVSFRVEDGEFAVEVINPAGSNSADGQSVGEAAMAGLICAFALREAAPKTNLLILDEPGHGLDAEGCRQFAKGILKLKERFETILLVTHSAYISSILGGETIYTVRKRNGRSRLLLSSGVKEQEER